jgi:predicted secreted protein
MQRSREDRAGTRLAEPRRMKILRHSLFLLVLAACGGDDAGELAIEGDVDVASESKDDLADSSFTVFEDDVDFEATEETRKIFIAPEGYQAYFGKAPPADIDWQKEWVMFYSAGSRSSGGYDAQIRRISLSATGRTLKVTTSLASPGAGCFVTQAFTRPFALARFARPTATPEFVRFYRDDFARDCDAPPPVVIDDRGDGQTFPVTVGQDIVLRLPANPTTGYAWKVVSTNRTFGYPVSTAHQALSESIGGGGVTTMTWLSKSVLSLVGSHQVVLEYRRDWGEAERTFWFAVEISE